MILVWASWIFRLFPSGRTGRFGRRGISINFVHDQKTWMQMEQIEKATGKKIIRIETNDLDQMEEVTCLPSSESPYVSSTHPSRMLLTDDEEGFKINVTGHIFCTVDPSRDHNHRFGHNILRLGIFVWTETGINYRQHTYMSSGRWIASRTPKRNRAI